MTIVSIKRIVFKSLRASFYSLGVFFFLLLVLSFTRVPYDIHIWLGTSDSKFDFIPDEIIFLGGSGMPSEANLIRIYHTSLLAENYNRAGILIAHPNEVTVIDALRNELLKNNIDSSRIRIEIKGTNTREQAVNIASDFPGLREKNIVIVTSPENMRRTVKTFRKAGFLHVGGQSSFEFAMFSDLDYDFSKAGGKIYSPDVSDNLALRYNFWNYLKLEITCLREFFALGYYKLNGWI